MEKVKPNMMKEMQANIIELMKTEGDNWTKSWVEVGLPMNVKTKKHYRGGNVFNLNYAVMNNQWKCNQWGTFKQWNELGHKIKKGSKGTQVYYWELREKKLAWLTEAEKAKYHATKNYPPIFYKDSQLYLTVCKSKTTNLKKLKLKKLN